MIWFSADYHFGHENIIKYASRPFKSVEQMNETLLRNHNSRVKKGDFFFHIGDFCFRNAPNLADEAYKGEGLRVRAEEYAEKLNGHLTFIKGNHDRNNSLNAVINFAVINLGGQDIFLTHNPENASGKYKINLVGHVHHLWKVQKVNQTYLVNVGCDVWKFHPININEIIAAIAKYDKEKKK